MDPGEMSKVGKIFDLTRSITVPLKGPGQHNLPRLFFQLWQFWQRKHRVFEGDPDEAIAFQRTVGGHARLGWHLG